MSIYVLVFLVNISGSSVKKVYYITDDKMYISEQYVLNDDVESSNEILYFVELDVENYRAFYNNKEEYRSVKLLLNSSMWRSDDVDFTDESQVEVNWLNPDTCVETKNSRTTKDECVYDRFYFDTKFGKYIPEVKEIDSLAFVLKSMNVEMNGSVVFSSVLKDSRVAILSDINEYLRISNSFK